jgi:hypothetical protein
LLIKKSTKKSAFEQVNIGKSSINGPFSMATSGFYHEGSPFLDTLESSRSSIWLLTAVRRSAATAGA